MPQPLSRFSPNSPIKLAGLSIHYNGDIPIGAGSIFGEAPELGFMAMEVIASWSRVELAEYTLFAQFAGGATSETYDIYVNMRSQGEKSSLFNRYADKNLDARERELFYVIRKLSASYAKQRDRIAHWSWGWMLDRKDGVLCVDPRQMVLSLEENSVDHIYVYTKQDFATIASSCQILAMSYSKFGRLISAPAGAEKEELYASICRAPDIADHLAQSRRKSRQEEEPQPPTPSG